ncbi:D-arabinose 5-phosphate isomerase [Candidatus Methylomirabilis lanthanidiphila]|uniref:D-arabinose 5-phosphate isomerase n=1 Tax=Candidatus Methylomirabilis lanthanidiphila TaxID=2211376 RepID=A0A564ZIK5_9BACT|nr:KpsF/GutQ family sugar-phosphate isomerase [Candidatus Methylomirabilis lanthanidiphila]VUZ84926.1 D-arabinose 5-phosphate isomerase [Candidatus Methylomirabilis lanthanidiphila]
MIADRGRQVLQIEAEAILALIPKLDARFDRAVAILRDCRGRVVLTGMGKSGSVAQKIASTLASTGTPAFFLHPAEGGHGDLGMLVRGDVVIAISNSGETDELVGLLPAIKRLGLMLIALVGDPASTLARQSDVAIDVGVAKEACPLALAPTASTTAALAMGDALAVALLEQRGFTEADFALLHPAGSLGRRLLWRVQDLMHIGEQLPVIGQHALMRDALVEISRKRLGMTAVVDEAGMLTGIISDGDLRRALQNGIDLLQRQVKDCMTAHPKTINRDALAAQALEMMERHAITSLLSVDPEGRPEGVIHLHDLLRAGVV